jgi:hypothetical protein
MLALHLLQISLVYINTLMIQRILGEPIVDANAFNGRVQKAYLKDHIFAAAIALRVRRPRYRRWLHRRNRFLWDRPEAAEYGVDRDWWRNYRPDFRHQWRDSREATHV